MATMTLTEDHKKKKKAKVQRLTINIHFIISGMDIDIAPESAAQIKKNHRPPSVSPLVVQGGEAVAHLCSEREPSSLPTPVSHGMTSVQGSKPVVDNSMAGIKFSLPIPTFAPSSAPSAIQGSQSADASAIDVELDAWTDAINDMCTSLPHSEFKSLRDMSTTMASRDDEYFVQWHSWQEESSVVPASTIQSITIPLIPMQNDFLRPFLQDETSEMEVDEPSWNRLPEPSEMTWHEESLSTQPTDTMDSSHTPVHGDDSECTPL